MSNARPSRPSGLRQLMATLALVAAVLGSLVPSGWMPQAAADGRLSLVICSSEGLREITLDAHGNSVDAETGETDRIDGPCAFAGLTGIAVMPDTPDYLRHALPRHRLYVPQAVMPAPGQTSLPGQRAPPQGRFATTYLA